MITSLRFIITVLSFLRFQVVQGQHHQPELVSWLLEAGATFPKASLSHDDDGIRGMISSSDIKDGEVVISIPLSYPHVSPYRNALPAEKSHFPIFWSTSEDDLAWKIISGSNFKQRVENEKAGYVEGYRKDVKESLKPEFTLDDYIFLSKHVWSRTFGIQLNGEEVTAIIPFADMINHAANPNCEWGYDNNASAFLVTATSDIAAGTSLSITYGSKRASTFLLEYGFIPEDATDDLLLYVFQGRPYFSRREARKIKFLNGTGTGVSFTKNASSDHSRRGVSLARLAVASDAELDLIINSKYNALEIPPLSARNEMHALAYLRSIVRVQMQRFYDSSGGSEGIMADLPSKLSSAESSALDLISREKKLAHYYIEFTTEMMRVFQDAKNLSTKFNATATANAIRFNDSAYFQNVVCPLIEEDSLRKASIFHTITTQLITQGRKLLLMLTN